MLQALSYLHRHGVIHRDPSRPTSCACATRSRSPTSESHRPPSRGASSPAPQYMAPSFCRACRPPSSDDLMPWASSRMSSVRPLSFRSSSMSALLADVLGPDGETYLPPRVGVLGAAASHHQAGPGSPAIRPTSSRVSPTSCPPCASCPRAWPVHSTTAVTRPAARPPAPKPPWPDPRAACDGQLVLESASIDSFLQAALPVDRPEELHRLMSLFVGERWARRPALNRRRAASARAA